MLGHGCQGRDWISEEPSSVLLSAGYDLMPPSHTPLKTQWCSPWLPRRLPRLGSPEAMGMELASAGLDLAHAGAQAPASGLK